jgi:hypothetical protein
MALENITEPQAAPETAESLAAAPEALANKMEPQAAAEVAKGLAAAFDAERLSGLRNALANKTEPQAAAEIAKGLATALENPQESVSDRLFSLGQTLAAVCRLLPSTHRTHLLALSNMLLQPVAKEAANGEEQPKDRKLLTEVCALPRRTLRSC